MSDPAEFPPKSERRLPERSRRSVHIHGKGSADMAIAILPNQNTPDQMWMPVRGILLRNWCRPAQFRLDFTSGGHHMREDGYSLIEVLLVLTILLIVSALGAWKFMQALQGIADLLELLK
jgi:prepilin-type N-terminal cleavage/methylation domain-containing protein